MELYSYRGQEPNILPSRHRLENGETRTNLHKLSKSKLESIGFIGPIEKPFFNEDEKKLLWDGQKYNVVDLSDLDIISKEGSELSKKQKNINYILFWDKFLETTFYARIYQNSLESVESEVFLSHMKNLIDQTNNGVVNIEKTQSTITNTFFKFIPTSDEIKELKQIMSETLMDSLYILPYENALYYNFYNKETNSVIPKSPFDSWILIGSTWCAPITYPKDGKVYNWDETIKNWKEI
jgi:hypothetical protein